MSTMDEAPFSRRSFLGSGATLAALAASGALPASARGADATTLSFRLRETAGLRRFGYPVQIILPLLAGPGYRLESGGKPVAAQFRTIPTVEGGQAVALDFNASPGPLEEAVYVVRGGLGIDAGSEPKRGLEVEQVEGMTRVVGGGGLTFAFNESLRGFLGSVKNAGLEFVKAGGAGLSLGTRNRESITLGATGTAKQVVTRKGPLAVGLRWEGAEDVPTGGKLPFVIDLTIPSSKSWVEARLVVDDTEGAIAEIRLDLHLLVEGEPTLVDLGAGNTVYGQLRGLEEMTLVAGPSRPLAPLEKLVPWVVRKGQPGAATDFAKAPSVKSPPAEGWAHVMDRTRCTAVAVAGFGGVAADQIVVSGDGRLRISRQFGSPAGNNNAGPDKGKKSLRFWLHFVTNPVQVGAATSPQAMLAPLEVEWLDETAPSRASPTR